MVALYQSADAFVLPTHGEGWGLPITEAMACGLPVITTGFSAILDYANKENALLLDYKLVPAEQPLYEYFFKGSFWAEPSAEQLGFFMRRLFTDRNLGSQLGRRACSDIRARWTWRRAAHTALDILKTYEPSQSIGEVNALDSYRNHNYC